VRQQERRDVEIILEQVALGDAGPERLAQVGDRDLTLAEFQDRPISVVGNDAQA